MIDHQADILTVIESENELDELSNGEPEYYDMEKERQEREKDVAELGGDDILVVPADGNVDEVLDVVDGLDIESVDDDEDDDGSDFLADVVNFGEDDDEDDF